jgi:hypothetical protein
VTIEGRFGKYTLQIARNANGYHVERALALYPLAVPAGEYGELRDFLMTVQRLDRTALVFRRLGGPEAGSSP